MARENKTQYAILGLLSKRPMSGYDLKKLIDRISKFHWTESNAQIYPTLKKLECNQLVKSKVDQESGARKRRLYHITQQGLDLLKVWLEQPVEPTQYREELLLKLSIGEQIDKPVLIQHLERYQQQIINQQSLLKERQQHIKTTHQGRPDQPYLLMTYHYAEITLKAKLNWCQQTLNQLIHHST